MARAPFALVLVEIGFGQPVVVGVPGMRALVVNGIDAIGALAAVVGQPLARRSCGVLSLHRRCSCKRSSPQRQLPCLRGAGTSLANVLRANAPSTAPAHSTKGHHHDGHPHFRC
jgi:hypothetical protein